MSRRAEKAARRAIMDAAPCIVAGANRLNAVEVRYVDEKVVSHAANVAENPQKSAGFAWDKRRSSVLAALSSGTHSALSLAGESPREMADRCIVAASTIRDMCAKRSVPNAYSLLLIAEQYPQVLDAWLALIGKKAAPL